jgi:mRNA-degrading endonuclease RelE of RelBE toxin-antitoxin system
MRPFDFVESPEFTKNWAKLGLTDDDLRSLQRQLLENPEKGKVIPGSSGHRKLRIKLKGKGKRGGARVIYLILLFDELIRLIDVYAKNE